MLGGITTTLFIGLPPLPAPQSLIEALQKIEIETSTELASVFRLRFGLTQSPGLDWDLVDAAISRHAVSSVHAAPDRRADRHQICRKPSSTATSAASRCFTTTRAAARPSRSPAWMPPCS